MPFFYDSKLNLSNRKINLDFSNLDIIYYDDDQKFEFNGEEIKFVKTPGHTCGGVCYIFRDNIFTGDTLFKMSYGRTDFPTGDFEQLIQSVRHLIESYPDNYKIYPGHDSTTTIGAEKKLNPLYLYISKNRLL